MDTVYQKLQEMRSLVANPYNCKDDNRRLDRMIRNHDPSMPFKSNPEYKYKKIYQTEVFYQLPLFLAADLLIPLLLKIVLVILCVPFKIFCSDSIYEKIKNVIYFIPYTIGNLFLEGRRGLFTSEPSYFYITVTGLFFITVVLALAVFVYRLCDDINDLKRHNRRVDEERREERSEAFEFRERARANPSLFEEYKAELEAEKAKNLKREREKAAEIKTLMEAVNLPPQYCNTQAIDIISQYIQAGRAVDVVGAINEIVHDNMQQQILAQANAARVAQERTAAAQEQMARAAQDAADQARQMNSNYWYDRYSRK